jgi:hypothetical protein
LHPKGKKMNEELIVLVADLLVRVSALEKILIDKQVLKSEDISTYHLDLANMLTEKLKEVTDIKAKEKKEV